MLQAALPPGYRVVGKGDGNGGHEVKITSGKMYGKNSDITVINPQGVPVYSAEVKSPVTSLRKNDRNTIDSVVSECANFRSGGIVGMGLLLILPLEAPTLTKTKDLKSIEQLSETVVNALRENSLFDKSQFCRIDDICIPVFDMWNLNDGTPQGYSAQKKVSQVIPDKDFFSNKENYDFMKSHSSLKGFISNIASRILTK